MEKRIVIPDNINVDVKNKKVIVIGPKGELKRDFSDPRFDKNISIEKAEKEIIVTGPDKRKMKSMIGTTISHIKNMIIGVTYGHKYTMKIIFTHFPITVEMKDRKVLIRNFLGEKGARVAKIFGDVEMKVQKDEIVLVSRDKEAAGQTAANIEKVCKLSKRDRRIFSDGIFISSYKIGE